ncbi:hypothetical protein COB21_05310 [Candidatus Aerophobetes bacterium]|uniref:Uncharacterized protein n=1 Tax=Aerophobetes bacterium TaxID=2030807 RepID=A0A2A4WZS9_UNCAE|nr:MAG: hypothetical protein COB21_05310 [Candidatus Aerophobetes bacterium]
MTETLISESLKSLLESFLLKNKKADLLTTYFFFLEKKYNIQPVLFVKEKTIYQSKDSLIKKVDGEGKLCRETEIKIKIGKPAVNAKTRRIYICPYSGKVFGDNTHPNAQDAIYDWVSTCPENTERLNGMRVKRFFVSEDPAIIKNYVQEHKKTISKTVFSSGVTGKLFNDRASVVEDFEKNQLKPMNFMDVPAQNRFEIETTFMQFIQTHLDDAAVERFFEDVSSFDSLSKHVDRWLEE